MEINKNVFRAYDIRGIVGEDINADFALALGKAVGTFLTRLGRYNMCCGRDGRTSSPELQAAFIEGVISTGLNVHNIGLATSPMLYWAACIEDFDCGVNVTASHNPKEYNGFKIVDDHAHSVYGNYLQEIYAMMIEEDFDEADEPGKHVETSIKDRYLAELHSKVKIERPVKVVVDTGNGVGGPFVRQLFGYDNVDLTVLYEEVDGEFPNHIANPEKYENLLDLSAKVVELGADFGIGFDGDADRIGVVDEQGNHYSCDLLLMLLARDALFRNPGATIIHDIKTSRVVENDIKNHGGVPIRTKTGHSHIEVAMHEKGAILGGEISGHMFFKEDYYGFDDAFLAALKVTAMLAASDQKFSEFFEDLPEVYSTEELRIECDDDKKFGLIEEVTEIFKRMNYDVLTIDGAFVELGEYSWGAVRASNTAPQLTLRFESNSKKQLNDTIDLFHKVLSDFDFVDPAALLELKV